MAAHTQCPLRTDATNLQLGSIPRCLDDLPKSFVLNDLFTGWAND